MFVLKANPTFRAKVKLPVPGADSQAIEFVFRHKRRSELKAFADDAIRREDMDVIMDVVEGWSGVSGEDGAVVPFSRDAVARLVEEFPAAGAAIVAAYIRELTDARVGN